MNSEQDLIQRLMISKKIMDKHNDIGRGHSQGNSLSSPVVEEFSPIQASYNLPQEFLSEQNVTPRQYNNETPTSDRIMGSRLPDEIKQLMIEHPIQQPNMGVSAGSVLSSELVEKASRLMNTNARGEVVQNKQQVKNQLQENIIPNDSLKKVIRETMEEVLRENGLMVESETKSNDLFKFRVGEHIFEGKIVRVKKVSK